MTDAKCCSECGQELAVIGELRTALAVARGLNDRARQALVKLRDQLDLAIAQVPEEADGG